MSIFSWLFSKNTEKNSMVRKWIRQEMKKVDIENPDVYALFLGLIQTAVSWGKSDRKGQDDQNLQVSKQYLGDATIFEIAAYTYYRVEIWLDKEQPELAKQIALPIREWIAEKFHTVLYVDERLFNQLFEEQLLRYRSLTSAGKGLTELHLELEQRILLTKGDRFNKQSLAKDSASAVLDSQYIKNSLAKYEEINIPEVIASIRQYCEKHSKMKFEEKKSKGQLLNKNHEQRDYLYGMALLEQQDWVRACNAFTKVLSANPKHYDALIQRGLLYGTLGQYVDALQDFTAAIEVNPNESAAYLHRGKCYHRSLRAKDKSLADYSEAIRLSPNNAAGYFGRGELYDEIALHKEKQALEKNDHLPYAHVSEEFLAAIHDYSQVIVLEPEHDAAYANRALLYARKARAYQNMDDITNAIADFEKAMSLNWEHGYLYKQQDEMKELLEDSQLEKEA